MRDRSFGFLEGSVAEADRAEFDWQLSETVLTAVSRYPRLKEVRLGAPSTSTRAPPVCAILDLYFGRFADRHAALAGEIRQ